MFKIYTFEMKNFEMIYIYSFTQAWQTAWLTEQPATYSPSHHSPEDTLHHRLDANTTSS